MTRTLKLVNIIAIAVDAHARCVAMGNGEWAHKWQETLDNCAALLPSGSGFDKGTTIDRDGSKPNAIKLLTAFHHMDENGMYDGWTDHVITARPSFIHGIELSVSGRDRNAIKDYIHETFDHALSQMVEWGEDGLHLQARERIDDDNNNAS